jgi:thiol:disulfide interchange protein DsbC
MALVLSALSLGMSYSSGQSSVNHKSSSPQSMYRYSLPEYKTSRKSYSAPKQPFNLDRESRVDGSVKARLGGKPEDIITEALKKIEPGIRIDAIKTTDSEHLYEVVIAVGSLYVTSDGKYMFKADAFDIENQTILRALPSKSGNPNVISKTKHTNATPKTTVVTGNPDAISTLSKIKKYVEPVHPSAKEIIDNKVKPRHFISYPRISSSSSDAELVVFTDPTCINCRNFHKKIDEFTDMGVTVKYLPYPRGGVSSAGYKLLDSVYCLEDPIARKDAMNNALRKKSVTQDSQCKTVIVNSIPKYFKPLIGGGTPRIVTNNGYVIRGNHDVKDIMEVLSLPSAY